MKKTAIGGVLLLVSVALLVWFLLTQLPFGRELEAIGSIAIVRSCGFTAKMTMSQLSMSSSFVATPFTPNCSTKRFTFPGERFAM